MKNVYFCDCVFKFFCIHVSVLFAIQNMDIVLVINYLFCLILQEHGLFKPKLSAYHKISQRMFVNCKSL